MTKNEIMIVIAIILVWIAAVAALFHFDHGGIGLMLVMMPFMVLAGASGGRR
jgi:hypothetical protein